MLARFNEKANRVIQSKFYKEAKEKTISFTVQHHWEGDQKYGGRTFEADFHNPDFIEQVLIPLRQFFMAKEGISLRKLRNLYHDSNIPQEYIERFDEIRNPFNSFLDSNSMTVFEEKYSNREIWETIVNGEYFHDDTEKRKLLEKWRKDEGQWGVCWMVFQQILYKSIEVVDSVSKLNEEVLKKCSSYST